MSDTPRTDAAVAASKGKWSFVLRDTCRELERELAALRFAAARVEWKYGRTDDGTPKRWKDWEDLRESLGEHVRQPQELAGHASAKTELAQIKAILADPVAVHLNMLQGTIAWTRENLRALLGDMSQESENCDTSKEHVAP